MKDKKIILISKQISNGINSSKIRTIEERKEKRFGKLTFIGQRVCDGPEEREERKRLEPGDKGAG